MKKTTNKTNPFLDIEGKPFVVGAWYVVTRKAITKEGDWNEVWVRGMDKYVTKSFMVLRTSLYSGAELMHNNDQYAFPGFVLKRVKNKRISMKILSLNSKYDAIIDRAGITVGCQTFNFKKLDELISLSNTLRTKKNRWIR